MALTVAPKIQCHPHSGLINNSGLLLDFTKAPNEFFIGGSRSFFLVLDVESWRWQAQDLQILFCDFCRYHRLGNRWLLRNH